MSLAPTIEDSGGSRKNKTSVRKKILLSQSCKKTFRYRENCRLFVTCVTYILVCYVWKCKWLWRGRCITFCKWVSFFTFTFMSSTLISHNDNDLLPQETLSVLSYEFCDSPTITVIHTEWRCGITCLWLLHLCFHQPCDRNVWEGLVRSVWCCLLSPYDWLVCKEEKPTFISSCVLHHYMRR
jgi:hypothetical protein